MASSMEEETQPNMKKDWYQSETHVTVSILSKHTSKEDCCIKFEPDEITVQGKLAATGKSYTVNLKLSKSIVPERSSYKVLPSKLEIFLAKTDAERWDELERTPPKVPKISASHGRDWDKVVNEMTKDDDDDHGKSLFKKIYSKGSDEVRKAMNKSYMESGGTVLSTNWKNVSKNKVEVQPPEGMEWKKWDKKNC